MLFHPFLYPLLQFYHLCASISIVLYPLLPFYHLCVSIFIRFQNFVHFTTIPPFCLEAEHCKYIMLRFEAKRRIMYLQCSALTKMGGKGGVQTIPNYQNEIKRYKSYKNIYIEKTKNLKKTYENCKNR